ncbi:MAG TPA: tRNA pseudouridine(55) synthase TruB [Candidatus Deferrimicrobiaceae bacterium]|nr:tRNA pseudouridine(55) synthase TruB [Candidatus Deferrimicrobiaceae bacterium]
MSADGVIVLDKPSGITSFRAVERVSRVFRGRKCGHAGTLDPIATGVLPICVGRATKIAGYLAAQEKEYDVFFRFGVETDTGDAAGRQIDATPGKSAEEDAVRVAIDGLVGEWEQVPPAYSAIKVAGARAYKLARQGKPVELAARKVNVYEARVLSWSPEGFRVFLRCSKGFYVRALSRDLGKALGVAMTVSGLRRLRSGPFRIEDSISLADFVDAGKRGEARGFLVPIDRALSGFPRREIPAEAAAAVRQGRSPAPWLEGRESVREGGIVLLTSGEEGPVALVERAASGQWKIVRGI